MPQDTPGWTTAEQESAGSSGSQVDWGVVQGMIGTVFTGIGTIVSASNQDSTITTATGETYTVTNDGHGGYQAQPHIRRSIGSADLAIMAPWLLAAAVAYLVFSR